MIGIIYLSVHTGCQSIEERVNAYNSSWRTIYDRTIFFSFVVTYIREVKTIYVQNI